MANRSIETGTRPLDAHQESVLAAIPESGSIPINEALKGGGNTPEALVASLRLLAWGYTKTAGKESLERTTPPEPPKS